MFSTEPTVSVPFVPFVPQRGTPPSEETRVAPITFSAGLVGLGSYRAFLLADVAGMPGMHALVAADDHSVQLSVVDASVATNGYPIDAARAAANMLGEEVAVALVVVRPADGSAGTINLRAPIVIGLTSHRGVQVVLDDAELPFAAPF